MTEPVRPVAPESPLVAKWRAEASYTSDRGFALALIKCARELESLAAAPVPCAASPADPLVALVEDFNGWWFLNREGSVNAAYARIDAFTKEARRVLETTEQP